MIPALQRWPDERAARYRAAGYWTGETLGDFLRTAAARFAGRTAVVGAGIRWSYAELDADADRFAAGFAALGLRPGDRMLVQLPNVPEFIAVVFGLVRAGVLPVFALPAHRRAELSHFARASEAVGCIVADRIDGHDMLPVIGGVLEDCPALRQVIVAGEAGAYRPLAGVRADGPGDLPVVDPSAVAFMQLSGGSTGLAKLIPRTHDDYLYSVRASADICGLGTDTVYLAVLPIAHNYPMSSPGFLGVLHAGGTVVLSPSPAADVAFPLIAAERVTMVALVPPLALAWLDAAARGGHDLSSLQLIQVGGAKLLAEVARRIPAVFGCALQQVFGMAEGLVNYTRTGDPDEIVFTTQGRPISPDDEVLIVGDDDRPVPEGEPGHLLTRGPYTIGAYHDAPGANARAFTADGFYRTGDIVRRRAGGYLEVMGRSTDQINRGGEKISPEEIEEHLLAHPAVHDAALVALPDEWLGERSVAMVVARGERPSSAEMKAWIRGRGLAQYKVPDRIVFVEAFPATGVGKVSRRALRAAVREALAPAPSTGVIP